MIELNDFERAIFEYIWPGFDKESWENSDIVREITRNQAAEILALAKKELMKDAIEASATEEYISTNGECFGFVSSRDLSLDYYGLKDNDSLKILILKDHENS